MTLASSIQHPASSIQHSAINHKPSAISDHLSPMHLAIDISSIPYGTGVSRYTANLVRALAELHLGGENQVTLFGSSLRQQAALKAFVASVPSDNKQSKILPLPPKVISFLINQINTPIETLAGSVDIFHAWDWYTPRSKKAKIVTTIHDLALFKFPESAHPDILKHHQQSLQRIEKNADAVITVSAATKQDILDLTQIAEAKIHVIPEALPEESIYDLTLEDVVETQKQYNITKPYLLIVGTQEPRKNIPTMVNVWQQHFSQDYQLVLAGRSAWDAIPDHPKLIKTGYIAGKSLAALYQGAAAFLYCSLYEGFGLPILEAFHYQTPVVTTNTSSMPEVAGEAASYVNNPQDVEEISQAIRQALNNHQPLIQQGTTQLAKFSWQQTAADTLSLYHTILE